MKNLKEQPVLGYGVSRAGDRVLITIGEDVRREGLSKKEAIELSYLLWENANEISGRTGR